MTGYNPYNITFLHGFMEPEGGASFSFKAYGEAVRAEQAAEVERLKKLIEATSAHFLRLNTDHPIMWDGAIDAAMEAVCLEVERQAAELAKFKALAETLAGALGQIEEGTYPRPLGKPWRMDASSSKHDRCIHDAWMYETCEGCLDAFVAEALRQYKEARDER